MSNQSLVWFPAVSSTDSLISNGSTNTSADQLEQIAANDITSSANYFFSVFACLGFLAGCFLLYSFIQTYRAQKRLAWLDCLLWAFCGIQLFLLLLSLHSVAHRPAYLRTTGLGCAALSFVINVSSLSGLLVLVLIAYVLTLDPPSNALLRRPAVCVALVILASVVLSVLLAGARGPFDDLHEESSCFMDPASSGVSYAAARLGLVFVVPYILQLGLLICGCVKQWKSKGRFLSGSEEGPMFLTVTLVLFLCQLFYSVALLRAATLYSDGLSHREQAFLSVAEFVLFSGSSFSLLLVLFLHRPCREGLLGVYRQLRDCCRSSGRTQTNRNIIAPHIEITDTLQDIES
ncbi:uncharacterized protein LOC141785101 [Halichoeres trimaculatus]|uniref:uncharacterized protein LOC141785101 n=1 Tax=Halichoeres trimaculatus TaxID=147232 RepID=UPI003D9F7474